jgi:hypothetical protein
MRNIPGFTAEASLYTAREHDCASQGRSDGGGVLPAQFDIPAPEGGSLPGWPTKGIVPQQQFPPDRDRPVVPYCDHSSISEEQCTPCLLRVLPPWPPTIGPRIVWRESVRRCITCYDHNGQPYPFCGPCFERACNPFVIRDRFSGIRLS